MKRANYDPTTCTKLIAEIAGKEKSEQQRGSGRLESRRRFRTTTPHAILAQRRPSVLHIDESGISNPQPSKEPTYFSLAGIAIAEEQIEAYKAAADEIKLYFFKRTDLTFHEPAMRHRREWFYFGNDKKKQEEFDIAIDALLEKTEFRAFGVGVRKDGFQREFVDAGLDPYLPTDVYSLAILMLLERYVDFLSSCKTPRMGSVIFESQGTLEDAIHQLEYARTLIDGSQWVAGKSFRMWLEPGLVFTPKCGSDPMEIADMFARDLFEWVRSECTDNPKRWELFSKKIYHRGNGAMGKFGVKIFPDADIRDRIEQHRVNSGCEPLMN